MLGVVSPATNLIWELSYAQVLSDEDWLRLEQAATQLAGSATLVSLGGTDAAEKGWANASDWQDWARQLADLGLAAKQAVDSKDQAALAMAGDTLVEVCESCHQVYLPVP